MGTDHALRVSLDEPGACLKRGPRHVSPLRSPRLFNNCSVSGTPVFAQYLKSSSNPTYTVAQINNYPTATSAVQVITTFLYAWVSDTLCKGARWPPLIFGAVSPAITCPCIHDRS